MVCVDRLKIVTMKPKKYAFKWLYTEVNDEYNNKSIGISSVKVKKVAIKYALGGLENLCSLLPILITFQIKINLLVKLKKY